MPIAAKHPNFLLLFFAKPGDPTLFSYKADESGSLHDQNWFSFPPIRDATYRLQFATLIGDILSTLILHSKFSNGNSQAAELSAAEPLRGSRIESIFGRFSLCKFHNRCRIYLKLQFLLVRFYIPDFLQQRDQAWRGNC